MRSCERCGGSGVLQVVARSPFGQVMRSAACDACHGEGRIPEHPCAECDGRGRVVGPRQLDVDVPAGIADGQRIRLPGSGHAGEHGGPAGDLYVQVHVRPHERLIRDGDDLVTVLDVPAPLAALGADLPAAVARRRDRGPRPHRDAAGRDRDRQGQGMPHLRRPERHGDLRVVVNVVIPRRLTAEQRELLGEPRRLADAGEPRRPRDDGREAAPPARRPPVIRLALRVRREDAEIALAELLELAPSGVEERELEGGAVIEYAVYGAPGELPALPDLQAAAGGALVEVVTEEIADDWHERWKAFHRPVDVPAASRGGAGLRVRPPWEPALEGRRRRGVEELVIDPGQAFGTGAHHTTRLCLELLLELEPGGPCVDVGCGSGRAGDRGRAAGLVAGARPRPRGRERRGDAGQRARERRERRGRGASTCCSTDRRRARRPCWRTCCARCCCASPTTGFDGRASSRTR